MASCHARCVGNRKASHSRLFMLVRLRTELPCSHEIAAAEVRKPRLLEHVASPLVDFEPIDPPVFPQYWSEGTYWVRLRILGFIPFGKQAVRVSFPPVDQGFAVLDNGYSALIKAWDHHITIRPSAAGCSYEDQVRVSAGILTPIVWLFAVIFYRHRQPSGGYVASPDNPMLKDRLRQVAVRRRLVTSS